MTYPTDPEGDLGINNAIYITEASQLANGIDPNIAYIIDVPNLDLGAVAPIVMNTVLGDEDFVIKGQGLGASWLGTTADGTPLFANKTGGFTAGTLYLEDINLYSSGVGGSIFALDKVSGVGAIQVINCNFLNSDSLGYLDSYTQTFFDRFSLIGIKDGLEHRGAWNGMVYNEAIVVPFSARFPGDSGGAFIPFDGTIFKAGAGLAYNGSFRTNINALAASNTSAICDFAPANVVNDEEFICDTVRANALSNPFPNMPASSIKALYKDCIGCENTYPGGEFTISTSLTTVIPAANTLTPMEGVGTFSNLVWFQQLGDNEFECITSEILDVEVEGTLNIDGGSTDVVGVQLQKYDAGTTTYIDQGPRYIGQCTLGFFGQQLASVYFSASMELTSGDRIRIAIENQSDGGDLAVITGGRVKVERRT